MNEREEEEEERKKERQQFQQPLFCSSSDARERLQPGFPLEPFLGRD